MNKKAVIKALLISILFGINSSYALFSSDLQENKQIIQDNLKGYSLFVPSGTTCNAILATDINSSNAILGQSINAVLVEDFKYQDTIIASKGSIIKGMISINKRKYQNNSNELQVKFTTI